MAKPKLTDKQKSLLRLNYYPSSFPKSDTRLHNSYWLLERKGLTVLKEDALGTGSTHIIVSLTGAGKQLQQILRGQRPIHNRTPCEGTFADQTCFNGNHNHE